MELSNDKVFELATNALKVMLDLYGPDHTFPPDVIWAHLPPGVVVPSTKKPHQPKRLMNAGLLELTGAMVKAQSEEGSGSIRKEYRFGPALVARVEKPAVPALSPSPSAAASGSFKPAVGALPPHEALVALQLAMDAEGYVISAAELANFYLAMTVSPLVILSGISGTGKSLLPRKFAKFTQSAFHSIPVQPQWSDNSDLFGFVPTLSPTKYVKGALVDSLLQAKKNPSKLVIALLDEMNLAPVEHYFSDFLSIAETRSRDGTTVVSDPLPIELPAVHAGSPDSEADLRGMRLPANLRVVGTANMDETTHPFSPKVLDRAFAIEFDDPDLTLFASEPASAATASSASLSDLAGLLVTESNAISIQEARAASQDMFEHVAQLLAEIQEILAPAGVKFGYRTRDAILLYLHFWRERQLDAIIAGYAALDFCVLQKVLPKISGGGDALSKALADLLAWFARRGKLPDDATEIEAALAGPLARSQQKVERMAGILELDGTTRFWGV